MGFFLDDDSLGHKMHMDIRLGGYSEVEKAVTLHDWRTCVMAMNSYWEEENVQLSPNWNIPWS